jgi:hypothetical protein
LTAHLDIDEGGERLDNPELSPRDIVPQTALVAGRFRARQYVRCGDRSNESASPETSM